MLQMLFSDSYFRLVMIIDVEYILSILIHVSDIFRLFLIVFLCLSGIFIDKINLSALCR